MVTVLTKTEEIWEWLRQVPDPEIPVLNLVDLGVIRGVNWAGKTLRVTVSPTYTGCPATAVIKSDIRAALAARGVENLELISQISPPWTTDWITPEGRAALLAYGIAPPSDSSGPDACPQCGSEKVRKISQFGSTPCKALWRCDRCLEPFDFFKCI